MPIVSIAKRVKGKIIHQSSTEGVPERAAAVAAAEWFMYLSRKYGINGIKPDFKEEGQHENSRNDDH